MFTVVLAFLVLLAVVFGPRLIPRDRQGEYLVPSPVIWVGRVLGSLVVLYLVLSTSIIMIPKDRVGIVTRIYGYKSLPEGHIIATNGETGIQAEPIAPGTFKVSLLFNILNHVETVPIVSIPNGFYGRVVARDGENLPEGQIMADAWPDADFGKYLDAGYFMTHRGQKGLQLSVLKPGSYPINTALFQVMVGDGKTADIWDQTGEQTAKSSVNTLITMVPAGFVGVIRSSVQDHGKDCRTITAKADTDAFADSLAAEVVPQGCRGVWQYALPPNDYYLNRDAYDVVLMDTRVQALEFKGGYNRRYIDLKVNSKGEFDQTERKIEVPQPNDVADSAVYTKAEGWEIPQELRVVLQIAPERAPVIVAAVGGLKEVEQRIMIPSIRSHVRNVLGGNVTISEVGADNLTHKVTRQTKVLDTIENRPILEEEVLRRVQIDGKRAGVDIKEIRFGESAIPPELLLARQREQLAEQLKRAFIQEQNAQTQRQQTEQARATADQQRELVTAQINLQTSKLDVEKRNNQGLGEQKYLESIAAGQKAQTDVLGQDRVTQLKMFEMILQHPEVLKALADVKLPNTVVFGSGGFDLNSVAAILQPGLSSKPQH